MKHCHFSILANEMPFLIQKLPFLYKHYNQIIFYDLNIFAEKVEFSKDGSHEYIQNFPDPEKKITLIEDKNINYYNTGYIGNGSPEKCQMFMKGSLLVKDDIDVFWCTDMDEFFNEGMIKEVEKVLEENENIMLIDSSHYTFWKNEKYIFCDKFSDVMRFFPRICRHKKGQIYGHCSLKDQYSPIVYINEKYYHFSCVGRNRMKYKFDFYSSHNEELKIHYKKYLDNQWDNFCDEKVKNEEIYNFPNMHPNPDVKKGIKRYVGNFPLYINLEEMIKMLGEL